MSISLQNLFTNSSSRFTLYFTATGTTYPPRTYSLSPPIDSRYLSTPLHSQNLARFSQRSYNLISFMTHHTTPLRVYGSQGTVQRNDVFGGLNFDSFLSIAELLCLVSSAAIFSIGFAANLAFLSSSKKAVLVDVGNRVSVLGVVLLAGGVAIGSWIRRQQWRRVSRERVTGGNEVNLLERVEKLEEDLRSSATIVRVLSRQLEKLGIRFRVTRKALKDPIAENMAPGTRRNMHPEGSSEPPPNEPEVIAAAASRLLQYFADDQGLGARNPRVGCTLNQFTQQHPPTFDGRAEALDAESWIKRMEKIFRALFCTDEQKVEYATYMLADEADEWWTSTRELLQFELGEGVLITWSRFKQTFLDRYFSAALREAKARQFIDLVQGTMTVERYTVTFVALSRFASYLVPDEEKKCEKFERGLQPRIRSRLIPLRIRSFTDLVTRATLIEEDMRANVELFNQRKRQQPPPEPNRNKRPASNFRPQLPQSSSTNPVCQNCGKRHQGSCLVGQNVCFRCGQPNHMARDCPRSATMGGQRTTAPARVFALTPGDAETSNDVVTDGDFEDAELDGQE